MSPTPLIPAAAVAERIAALGAELLPRLVGRDVTFLVLMDGAFLFAADLVRHLPLPGLRLAFRKASSYRGTSSTGTVTLDDLPDFTGRLVVVVDDIIDSGLTLSAAVAAARVAGASTVLTCILLDKPSRRVPGGLPAADLTGFTIPDRFVVGFGLDLDGAWRHLPDVCTLD